MEVKEKVPWQEKAALSVNEAGEVLGLSRNTIYEALKTGKLPGCQVGSKWLVSVPGIIEMLKGRNTAGAGK